VRPPKEVRRCEVDGCDRPHNGHGLCTGHGSRVRQYGEVFPDVPLGQHGPRLAHSRTATNASRPGSCGTCGAGDLRLGHADWCARVVVAAPEFAEAPAGLRVAS